ncbi:hypothetical protein B0T22DRAFT_443022 [Podospora appendiculata]|uniref:Uncharacterized protein n=1 Tax=Podospora appendiculata TaxID=314037 RepID=A0AAE0X6A3_9PEZI|nr:hypothetical protein B0T22DRAFT_443022 [Podospora appendiculata]
MSGFEIAGAVLGSLPIIVSGLQFYMEGASTIGKLRIYKRELERLILSIETEHVMLQDICEKLLLGIAPQTQIEEMIDDPFGALWKQQDTAEAMAEAIRLMMEKLNVGPDGKRHFKSAAFVLQRAEYQDLLSRIRDGVSSLQKMMTLNIELEPDRKRRSQGRLYKLAHNMSESIYQALCSAFSCTCVHDVGLRLTPPTQTIIPQDDDEDVLDKLQFRLAISQNRTSQGIQVRQWDEVALRPAKEPKPSTPSPPQMPPPSSSSSSFSKRARFTATKPSAKTTHVAQLSSTAVTLTTSISSLTLTPTASGPGIPRKPHERTLRSLTNFRQTTRGLDAASDDVYGGILGLLEEDISASGARRC